MTPQILVCDDEPHVIRAISLKLSRADFEVKGVLDLETCCQWLERHERPALLIIDDSLPSKAATADFLSGLRGQQRFANLPVIRLALNHYESFDHASGSSEFEVVLTKPFSAHELFESVCQMLGCDSGIQFATCRGTREFASV